MENKLFIAFGVSVLMSISVEAKILFACEGTFKSIPWKKTHVKLTQSPTKQFKLEKDGDEVRNSSEIVKAYEPDLKGLAEFLKCGNSDTVCKDKASKGKDPGFKDFAFVMNEANKFALMDEFKGSNTLVDLRVDDIKSGKSYIFGEKDKVPEFNATAVYEFYDKANKLLGRYIYAIEVLDCKDKATPTLETGLKIGTPFGNPVQ